MDVDSDETPPSISRLLRLRIPNPIDIDRRLDDPCHVRLQRRYTRPRPCLFSLALPSPSPPNSAVPAHMIRNRTIGRGRTRSRSSSSDKGARVPSLVPFLGARFLNGTTSISRSQFLTCSLSASTAAAFSASAPVPPRANKVKGEKRRVKKNKRFESHPACARSTLPPPPYFISDTGTHLASRFFTCLSQRRGADSWGKGNASRGTKLIPNREQEEKTAREKKGVFARGER